MNKATSTALVLRERMTERIQEFTVLLAGSDLQPMTLIELVVTAVANNKRLGQCTEMSLLLEARKAAADHLRPDGHEGALVPYYDKDEKVYKAVWIPMVAGIRKRAYRSGEIRALEAIAVYEGDEFEYKRGLHPDIHHVPCGDGETLTHAYSVCWLKDGFTTFEVMTRDQIEKIRERSKAKDSGPWVTDYDQMALKTVVKRHAKTLPTETSLTYVMRRGDDDEPEDHRLTALSYMSQPALEGPRKGGRPPGSRNKPKRPQEGDGAELRGAPTPAAEASQEPAEAEEEAIEEGDPILARRPKGWRQNADYLKGRSDFEQGFEHCLTPDINRDADRHDMWVYGYDDARREKEERREEAA